MTLGERIARLRKTQGLKQEELASKVGIHDRHLSRLEHDKMHPSSKTLTRIAEVLSVTVDELVGKDGAEGTSIAVQDQQLLRAFQQAQELDSDERVLIIRLVQALVAKKRMEKALKVE